MVSVMLGAGAAWMGLADISPVRVSILAAPASLKVVEAMWRMV
jgi:hypothetical protein